MRSFGGFLGTLSDDDQVRGRQFERVCKWWLENDPRYRRQLKRVWLWDEWPGRWGADAGIDLVAEDRGGGLWAIQAKAYHSENTVTKHDVDTFLSESARPEFAYRLLIATTNRLSRNGERAMDAQEKPVGRVLRSALERSPVLWPRSLEDLRPPEPMPAKPRRHQRQAIAAVLDGFEVSDRGQLIMACGTGKTLTALWLHEQIDSMRTLVLVPSLGLLGQTLREWTAHASSDFEALPVCSDDTVRGSDALVAHTGELGLPVTTDPAEIAGFLRRRSPRVVFATYQSSPRIAEAFSHGRVPGFDLVIADEAHRCAGRVSSDFATVLDPSAIRAKKRLFMTATPRFFTERIRSQAREADFEVASMDDEETFGPVFHTLSFGDAIERDLLSDYQVVIIGVDDATYRQYAERGRFVTTDGRSITDARTLASQIGLAKALRDLDLRRTISFHSRVSGAQRFADEFPSLVEWMPEPERPDGEVLADHVSGTMPTGQRDIRLEQLRDLDQGQRRLLSNARCLSEGVDVPTLDGVAFIDPRRSQVDIVQAVGRAIRKAEDKKVGTIVLPVFVGGAQDAETAVEDSAFEPVWAVVKALRAHDDALAEELDALRREMGRKAVAGKLPSKIVLDLPAKVGVDFVRAFRTQLVEQSTARWEQWYGLLNAFVAREGHARVSQQHAESGWSLGSWVTTQRTEFNKGKLRRDRAARLEAVPGWEWDPHAADWERAFELLQRFAAEHDHARVKPGETIDGFRLGGWVSKQRAAHRRGELDPERSGRLEGLDGWVWDAHASTWNQRFHELRGMEKHRRSIEISSSNRELTAWVARQRNLYRQGRLSATRTEKLESIRGWTWDTRADLWEKTYSALLGIAEQMGTSAIPQDFVTDDGMALGAWVTTQRQRKKSKKLSATRAARLEELPGWTWDPVGDQWSDGLAYLRSFLAANGHVRVPDAYRQDGFELGSWVRNQRRAYRKGWLTVHQIQQLESIPDWSWERVFDDRWDEGFAVIKRYVDREGSSLVPQAWKEDEFALGRWVAKQRSAHNRGSLHPDRSAQLGALPGWVWRAKDAQWEIGFEHLISYAEREGHAVVPTDHDEDGFRLGQWVSVQRTRYAKRSLSASRVERLQSVPGWMWDRWAAEWEEAFSSLTVYVQRTGHANVPGAHIEGILRLGQWVKVQRRAFNRGELDPERRQRLEQLPGWVWNANEARWATGITLLKAFIAQHGHARVPQKHQPDGFPLGTWVNTRRQDYKAGRLDPGRIEELESLPGWTWDARAAG